MSSLNATFDTPTTKVMGFLLHKPLHVVLYELHDLHSLHKLKFGYALAYYVY